MTSFCIFLSSGLCPNIYQVQGKGQMFVSAYCVRCTNLIWFQRNLSASVNINDWLQLYRWITKLDGSHKAFILEILELCYLNIGCGNSDLWFSLFFTFYGLWTRPLPSLWLLNVTSPQSITARFLSSHLDSLQAGNTGCRYGVPSFNEECLGSPIKIFIFFVTRT